jgi:glycosyltransferase involved in cell wall biosynthesis
MTTQALVSVIIPCYNAEKYIIQTLETVFAQSYTNYEIIVIDDGSTDNSYAILQNLGHPKVKIFKQQNQGPSVARNYGMSLAKGKYLQFLDSDDLLLPEKLAKQVAILEANDADVAYGNWIKFETNTKNEEVIIETIRKKLTERKEITVFLSEFWCPPAVLLYSRNIVAKIGTWNTKLPIIQDARFLLDAVLKGGKFVYTDELVAKYRVHQTGSVSTKSKVSFTKDCYQNAKEVHQLWLLDIQLGDLVKKSAIFKVYSQCIRSFSNLDSILFEQSIEEVEKLFKKKFIPQKPISLKYLSYLFGYRKAEKIASYYRKSKEILP